MSGRPQFVALAGDVPPTDAELVAAARDGHDWAREALFRRHAPMALGMAHRLMPHDGEVDGEVDDLVQDSFVSVLQRLERLQNPQAFAAWLGSTVLHAVGKRLRRRRMLARLGLRPREVIDPDAVAAPNAPAEIAVELRRVYALVDRLPVEQRIALILRRVDEMEIPEIARCMGLSPSTVKRRLKAAEERLARTCPGPAPPSWRAAARRPRWRRRPPGRPPGCARGPRPGRGACP